MEAFTPISPEAFTPNRSVDQVELNKNAPEFDDWSGLLQLLRSEFLYTQGLVSPPSTVFELSETDLKQRAEKENLLLGLVDGQPVACLFFNELPDKLFLGRFAIASHFRGRGLARKMVGVAEAHARSLGLSVLELETRVNLTVNQVKFCALGFKICGGRAHEGYESQTTLTLRMSII
ncbi:MAG: GNAT family N-acetyltransferase [Rhizobiaceae bacterium]